MTLYDLKPRFQGLLRPLVRRLAAAGTTANQVTVLAAFGSLALGLWLLLAPGRLAWFLVPAWLLVRMACNAVDGMLAREHGQTSRLGAYLNELGDVVSDAALYLPFALLPGLPAAWVVAIVVLAGVSELAGVLGLVAGASRRYDGPLGKSDRALLFGLLGLGRAADGPSHAGWGGLSRR
jgi:CDP-diacylglycerol--glycerol-3-phosphate 3-phosphatidyltransferase